ncbi:TIGR03943 family protein [Austwickia chelonae]|uniref:DUF1980 domain-containing protein n=1 Tax=Austwickia chelonae NBRC 105200 TaxID=1184607 RepID=K6UKS8_9MICO|nr:TIGR03943 family protein [Austwickia chelonae]GAB76661.1 hypothetical protein AUCHE_02_00200 [Austwickia chelonae NBRC 105200]SEW28881.1 TIGR03943 family protein [Austwickia chelonae]
MNRLLAALTTLTCSVVAIRAVWLGDHLAYVKEGLTIPLLVAAGAVFCVGAFEWWQAVRTLRVGGGQSHRPHLHDEDEACASGGHRHKAGQIAPRIGWAMLVPFAILAAVPPTPVGAYTAQRIQANRDASVTLTPAKEFDPLDPNAEVLEMSVREFWERASFDNARSLSGRQVRMVAFASPDDSVEGGWVLVRMAVLCCAADAFPVKLLPVGAGQRPADGQWVVVEGTWEPDPSAPHPDAPTAGEAVPRLQVSSMTPTKQPAKPYV